MWIEVPYHEVVGVPVEVVCMDVLALGELLVLVNDRRDDQFARVKHSDCILVFTFAIWENLVGSLAY